MPRQLEGHERIAKGLRRASPSLSRKRFDIGQPIARIDIRVLPILLTFLCATGVSLLKPPQHALTIDMWDGETPHPLMAPQPQANATGSPWQHAVIHEVSISSNDAILWDGETVDPKRLQTLIDKSQSNSSGTFIQFSPKPNASYGVSAGVLNIIQRANVSFRIAGMQEHCFFESGWAYFNHSESPLAITSSLSAEAIITTRRLTLRYDGPALQPYHQGPCKEGPPYAVTQK